LKKTFSISGAGISHTTRCEKRPGGRTARSALFQVEQYRTLDKRITVAGCYSLGAQHNCRKKLAPFARATNAISSFVCLRGFSMATLFMYSDP